MKNIKHRFFAGFLPPTTYHLRLTHRRGQSLIEVLVAIVVGTIMIVGALSIITPVLKGNTDVVRTQTSTALGKELLDNIRVFAEADWHNLANLATSSANPYFIYSAASPFIAVTGTESVVLDVATTSVATSSLVGHWKLDEATGTTAYDYSDRGQHGVWAGSPVATSSCAVGGCLFLNGTNAYVDVGTSTTDSVESAGTLSAWVYRASSTGGIFNRSSGSSWADERLVVFFRSDTLGWGWSFANGVSVQNPQWASSTFPMNQWVHFVLTWDGSQVITYLDNSVFDNRAQTVVPEITGQKARIGWTEGLGAQYFTGRIDDVRLYNRALSAEEVAALYKSTVYTRYFYVDDAYRDGSGNIAGSGTQDPSTKKVTAVFGWASGATSTFITYLTRSFNRILWQTDWAGGGGQDGPATTTNSRFATSTSNINFTTSTGSVIINL